MMQTEDTRLAMTESHGGECGVIEVGGHARSKGGMHLHGSRKCSKRPG